MGFCRTADGLGLRLAPNRTFRVARRYFCRGFFGRLGLHDVIFFQRFSLHDVMFVADSQTFRFARRYFFRTFQFAHYFCRGFSDV